MNYIRHPNPGGLYEDYSGDYSGLYRAGVPPERGTFLQAVDVRRFGVYKSVEKSVI